MLGAVPLIQLTSEEHVDACELDETEEVFDVKLPSCYEPAELVYPGKESYDLPALLLAAKLAPVLRFASVAAVRGNHLNAVFIFKPLVELVRILRLVADQALGKFVEKLPARRAGMTEVNDGLVCHLRGHTADESYQPPKA